MSHSSWRTRWQGALLVATACVGAAAALGLPPREPAQLATGSAAAGAALASVTPGSCLDAAYKKWISATGCSGIDAHGRRRFSLALANCHLEASGRVSGRVCEDAPETDSDATPGVSAFTACLSSLTVETFSTFTTYTTHVDHLCYFLESSVWRDVHTQLLGRLIAASNATAAVMASVMRVSAELRAAQAKALTEAHALSRSLNESLVSAHRRVAVHEGELMRDLSAAHETTKAVGTLLTQVSHYSSAILALQGYVVAHLLVVQTVAYYFVLAAAMWLLTSQTSTAGARFPVLLSMLVSAGVEWSITMRADSSIPVDALMALGRFVSGLPALEAPHVTAFTPEHVHAMNASSARWGVRALHAVSAVALCLYHFLRFRDYAAENHRLLQQLQSEVRSLRVAVRRASMAGSAPPRGREEKAEAASEHEPEEETDDADVSLDVGADDPADPSGPAPVQGAASEEPGVDDDAVAAVGSQLLLMDAPELNKTHGRHRGGGKRRGRSVSAAAAQEA